MVFNGRPVFSHGWMLIRAIFTVMAFGLMAVCTLTSARAGQPLLLGMSAPFSGSSAGLGVELYRGSMAYFEFLNQQGGINGRPVDIVTLDDGYQPDPAVQNTIEFLERNDIACLFNYVGTPTTTRVLPLLVGYNSQDKYLFFPFSGAQPQRHPPYEAYVFNLRASYRQEVQAIIDKFLRLGRKRVAIFYQADAYGRSGWEAARLALRSHGLELLVEATYRRGTAFTESMAEQVSLIKDAEPDAVLSVGSYAACAAFIRDARDEGLQVPIANLSFVGSENMLELLEDLGCDMGQDYTHNLINTQVVPSYEDLSIPVVQEYRRLMDAMAPGLPSASVTDYVPLRYSFTSFEGFLNAKVMARVLEYHVKHPQQGLRMAAESLNRIALGINTPAGFSADRHQALDKVYFTTVRNSRFEPVGEEQWAEWQK